MQTTLRASVHKQYERYSCLLISCRREPPGLEVWALLQQKGLVCWEDFLFQRPLYHPIPWEFSFACCDLPNLWYRRALRYCLFPHLNWGQTLRWGNWKLRKGKDLFWPKTRPRCPYVQPNALSMPHRCLPKAIIPPFSTANEMGNEQLQIERDCNNSAQEWMGQF